MRLAVAMLTVLAVSIGGQRIARATSNVITVTDMSFPQEVTQSSGLVLIHFYADWVRGSRILSPTLDAIAVEYRGRLKVGKLNADENPVMPHFYGVQHLPTLILWQNGQPKQRFTGTPSRQILEQAINRYLGH